jgi:hypothetical protein
MINLNLPLVSAVKHIFTTMKSDQNKKKKSGMKKKSTWKSLLLEGEGSIIGKGHPTTRNNF